MKRFIFIAFMVFFFVLISVRSFDPAICTMSRNDMIKALSVFSIKQAPVAKTAEDPAAQEVADHVVHTPSE